MNSITINHFLILSSAVFVIGLSGAFLNRAHIIRTLLCVELMLLSVSLNMVAFSYFLKDYAGQVFTVFVLAVAAAEAAIGLAILVLYARNYNSIAVDPEQT